MVDGVMIPEPVALITVDVGGTLGTSDVPSLATALLAATQLNRQRAIQVLREHLHPARELTEQVIAAVCGSLRIPIAAFPRSTSSGPLRLFPGVRDALRQLSEAAPVVTLSNVTCSEVNLDELTTQLAPWVTGHYPSCHIGVAKPDPRAFQVVARTRGIRTRQIVHIGDHWECDILGATQAEATAIWISGGRALPDTDQFVRSNVLVAVDFEAAAGHVLDLCTRRQR